MNREQRGTFSVGLHLESSARDKVPFIVSKVVAWSIPQRSVSGLSRTVVVSISVPGY